jgi:NAD-dependent SIR2 family protein deacetylase
MPFTANFLDNVALAKQKIAEADAILVGAGAGLSTAAGLVYDADDFQKNFADFIAKYHFPNLYYGGFGPFENDQEMWAYWSRFINLERYQPGALPLYQSLLHLLRDKNYFVLTTNVDHCFQKAGFAKDRLFYTQGDYGLFQCSVPCHQKTYDNEKAIKAMLKNQNSMQIPIELIPKCPVCGKPMVMNLRSDDHFVEDEGWHEAEDRYELFLADNYLDKKIVYLEVGVGDNTPAIIKYPFYRLTAKNPQATYIYANLARSNPPLDLENQSIILLGDLAKTIALLDQ